MSNIRIVDSSARDGIQSLWAVRLTGPELLSIAPVMDRVGFEGIEFGGPTIWQYFARFLKEDGWERLRTLVELTPNTPMTMWIRSRGIHDFSSTPKPHDLARLWITRWAEYGVRRMVFLEEENDYGNIPELTKHAKSLGMQVIVPVMYSLSPVHTPEHYVERARAAVAAGADIIEIKDQSGLLTPETTRWFVKAIQEGAAGKADFQFQGHCSGGLGQMNSVEALKLGVTMFRCCVPPLSEGNSLPNAFTLVRNAEFLGHNSSLNLEAMQEMSDHFMYVAKKEGLLIGAPLEHDVALYDHHIPGGVQATLRWQLAQLKAEHRYQEVLAETARVRKDMGYPIMVTPTSQFIVAQATMNVLGGEPYANICDEVIEKIVLKSTVPPPGEVDPGLMDKIMSLPRTHEILERAQNQKEVTLDEMRSQFDSSLSDDDFLMRVQMNAEYYDAARGNPASTAYPKGSPVMVLLEELMQRKRSSIQVSAGDLSVSLRGGQGGGAA